MCGLCEKEEDGIDEEDVKNEKDCYAGLEGFADGTT